MKRTPFLATLAFLAGCVASPKPSRIPEAEYTLRQGGDPRVGTYVSSLKGFATNSFWIEGPEGLVLIDTQFLLSAATEAVDWAERTTGKKAKLAIVLHPNPDKFNGTELLKKRGIRVITSKQVADLIPAVHKDRYAAFYERFKPDYPVEAPEPEAFGDRTMEIEAAGLRIKLHVLGAGASGAHVVAEWEGHVFVGDLVASLGHPWLELGLVKEWLARLDEIWEMETEYVHPGRGPSGGDELLERQEAYLKRVLELMRKNLKRKDAVEVVRKALEEEHLGFSNRYFLKLGLPVVYERMKAGKL
jgi:glyoxylase-like metal-dependent hydrolase (beta-lactamase superfamily II)